MNAPGVEYVRRANPPDGSPTPEIRRAVAAEAARRDREREH